jgi:hypothetical protein
MTATPHPSSFRDPVGFLYNRGNRLLRQVNGEYAGDLEHLRSSGLLAESAAAGLTLHQEEVPLADRFDDRACAVFEPTRLAFVSYPYEWCPGQLRDAGLATIALQRRALARGMTLKDATAYNVQFHQGRPVHIDMLSFERSRAGRPVTAANTRIAADRNLMSKPPSVLSQEFYKRVAPNQHADRLSQPSNSRRHASSFSSIRESPFRWARGWSCWST